MAAFVGAATQRDSPPMVVGQYIIQLANLYAILGCNHSAINNYHYQRSASSTDDGGGCAVMTMTVVTSEVTNTQISRVCGYGRLFAIAPRDSGHEVAIIKNADDSKERCNTRDHAGQKV